MDIKLIEYELRVPEKHRLSIFSHILEEIYSPKYEFQKVGKKTIKCFGIQYFHKKTNNLIHHYEIVIVKNKTCYSVYCLKIDKP